MNFSKWVVTASFLLTATYCWASDESVLDLRYEAPAVEPGKSEPTAVESNCAVIIRPPNDIRLNKDTLGTTFRDNPIMSSHPATEWLQQVLLSLKKLGMNASLETAESDTPPPNAILLSTDLSKMYIWNHGMNLHATLVVKAKIQNGTASELQQSYRVIGTKLNWVNGDSEFVTTFNLAASRLLQQIAADVQKECRA